MPQAPLSRHHQTEPKAKTIERDSQADVVEGEAGTVETLVEVDVAAGTLGDVVVTLRVVPVLGGDEGQGEGEEAEKGRAHDGLG